MGSSSGSRAPRARPTRFASPASSDREPARAPRCKRGMKRLLVAAMLVLAGCGTGPAAGQNAHDYRLVVEKVGGNQVSIVTPSAPPPVSLPGGFLTTDGSQLFSSGGQVFGGAGGAAGKTVLNAYA